jgi:hypothetical protein
LGNGRGRGEARPDKQQHAGTSEAARGLSGGPDVARGGCCRWRACGYRLSLAEVRHRVAAGSPGGPPGRQARAEAARGAPAACPLAAGLPSLPGPCLRPLRGERSAVLALWPLAALHLGELASAGATGLLAVRRPSLLVPQPQEHRLQRLREAPSKARGRGRSANFQGTYWGTVGDKSSAT